LELGGNATSFVNRKCRMSNVLLLVLFLAALIGFEGSPRADMYQCRDHQNGVLFTNRPYHSGCVRLGQKSNESSGSAYYFSEPGLRYPSKPTDRPLYVHQDSRGYYYLANRVIPSVRLVQTVSRNADGSLSFNRTQQSTSQQATSADGFGRYDGAQLVFEGPQICVGFPLLPFVSCNIGCLKLR